MIDEKEGSELIEAACENGILTSIAEEYVIFCHTSEEKECGNDCQSSQKKKKSADKPSSFPNIAGFCRYFGIGAQKYERLSKKFPDEFEKLSAIFEDEALNSEMSASVLTAYLKKRLGYSESDKVEKSEVETGQLRLIFDHDILSDGE